MTSTFRTIIVDVDNFSTSSVELKDAASALRNGEVVAFPTETVYGLGANALNPLAIKKIYSTKGRPSDNPLIVHVHCKEMAKELLKEIPNGFDALADAFWPGPLTIIGKKKSVVPDETTGGLDTVGIRVPSHPAALKFIQEANCPVAAPSANVSGRPSPTSSMHVYDDLKDRIPYIISSNIKCDCGVESTIVDLTGEIPRILRPGPISLEQIANILNLHVSTHTSDGKIALAPGMKYRHYSPSIPVLLFDKMQYTDQFPIHIPDCIAVLGVDRLKNCFVIEESNFFSLGDDSISACQNLFFYMREIEKKGFRGIIIGELPLLNDDRSVAFMNRVKKASVGNLIFYNDFDIYFDS
eukprot:TRINITY_DN3143_c1_g4_i1.p1 TRINITY_DN3143_c1_g4~~TRINITY_DN3143_c1_g4_i1.p1  ORF type:complete len:354 (-),score=98.21 TRINITY_DN3143_c1_g4_i1:179-1240(-)